MAPTAALKMRGELQQGVFLVNGFIDLFDLLIYSSVLTSARVSGWCSESYGRRPSLRR